MKKYLRTFIIVGVLAIAAVGYYFYLANKDITQQAIEKKAKNDIATVLINKDFVKNYPDTPREVLKNYAEISKCYYAKETTEEQLDSLAKQARILLDDELNGKSTYNEFLTSLKQEVKEFKTSDIFINSYTVQSAQGLKYATIGDKQYASLHVLYYFREGSTLRSSYYKYTLRKNELGQWKILFWELDNQTE
jgi:hypothetical protein